MNSPRILCTPGRSLTRLFTPIMLSGLLAACSTPTVIAPVATVGASNSSWQSSWVVLGEQGQAVARHITSENQCPLLLQDGVAQRMQVRAAASTEPQRATVSKAQDAKASAFPVLVCDALIAPSTKAASIDGLALALPKAQTKKILVLGDTGCRLQKSSAYFQECNDSALWAFHQVVKTAVSFQPDLVLHVGDYHYRENACPADNPHCAGSPWGYGWDTWRADFFAPAAALLAVAPWVVVRGNHESCTRAGQGWWRLMDPRPLQPERDCNLAQNDATGDFSPPYAIPLGRLGSEQAQLIVFDSSKVPHQVLAKTGFAYQTYLQQFQQVNQLAARAEVNFFVNHHPILGFASERKQGGGQEIFPGNAALQDVMQNINAEQLFPAQVQATLSGHVHLFEAITFSSGHPAQFISGNGGSSLDQALPQSLAPGRTPYAAARVAHFSNSNEVGFMTMERDDKGWTLQAWNQYGKLFTSCQMQAGVTTCHQAQ
ncbi:metallophosphoesterase [soil metagenome]